jgi:hypothetical protein
MRASVSGRQDDVTRQLLFNVEVELLHFSLFEIQILRLDRTCKRGWVGRSREDWESTSDAATRIAKF